MVTQFEKITESREALGAFLTALPVIHGPWDKEFQARFCADCLYLGCDTCPHAVQLQRALVRAVADDHLVLSILGHADAEPTIPLWADGADSDGHIQHTALHTREIDLTTDGDVLMNHPRSPVSLQLPDRVLNEPPIFQGQFPGQSHLPEPTALV